VWHAADDGRLVGKTLRLALALDSRELALSLVSPLSVEQLTSSVASALVELLERYGSDGSNRS
jgi:flagellar biosynthesis/type III secretory pathway ATPase